MKHLPLNGLDLTWLNLRANDSCTKQVMLDIFNAELSILYIEITLFCDHNQNTGITRNTGILERKAIGDIKYENIRASNY